MTQGTNLGTNLQLKDFEQGTRERVDTWFRKATDQLYGPAFSMYATSDPSVPSSTWTLVPYALEEYQTNYCFNGVFSKFTAPLSGLYYFDAQFAWQFGDSPTLFPITSGVATRAGLFKNGSVFIFNQQLVMANSNTYNRVSGSMLLNKDDYVQVYAWQNSGGAIPLLTGSGGVGEPISRFTGFLVRPL